MTSLEVGLTLLLELIVRSEVGDEHLVCLFKWCVETILAADVPLRHADVHALAVLVRGLHVQYLDPHVLGVVVAWVREGALLSCAYFSFQ